MVEGPLVHRVAVIHRVLFLATAFAATSPSARFAEGARAIDGRYVSLIEAHGKNIFYFFTRQKLEKAVLANLPPDVVVVHIHFGLSGSFRTFVFPGPEPREKTRLRLASKEEKLEAQLSASVCLHGDIDMYRKTTARLGPDPLRIDADKEMLWGKMQASRKKIGSILMDQSLIAGIGNIYRSEILFVIGVHPDQPASTLSRSKFEKLWNQSVRLFRLGLVTGSIITVSLEDAGKPYSELKSGEGCYVYNHSICKVCGGVVRNWPSAGRTVYACEVCQPFRESDGQGVHKIVGEPVHSCPEQIKSSVKSPKKTSPTVGSRKGKAVDGKIVQHQPMKDLSSGGLAVSSSILTEFTGSTLELKSPGRGPSKNDPGWRAGMPRKYHLDASHCGIVIHERTSGCPWWPSFTNEYFHTRRVSCINWQIPRSVNPPRAIFRLQALRTLCLGFYLTQLKWSGVLSNVPPLLHA